MGSLYHGFPGLIDRERSVELKVYETPEPARSVTRRGATRLGLLELEAQAKQRQQEFNDDSDDPIVAMLTKYLDTRLPVTWDTMDVQARRSYLRDPDPLQADGTELRERVCAA